MQNSISRSIISTTMEIPKHVVIGKLIGRRGRKIKPIEKGTGTHILITTEDNLRQIEIRINRDVKDKNENISPGERINEAIYNRNQQHATPRNHKNNDPKEKRKRPKRRVPHTTQNEKIKSLDSCNSPAQQKNK
ncbi:11780_t:CDS:2 [Rhizophagus irregularis]|nr:11780_t:CDS:2 [Rhizophagus irregularis]